MDDTKRKALIKSQAAKKKESGDVAPTATMASNPTIKRKPPPKGDRQAKKPKVSLEPVVGLMVKGKTITPVKYGVGKSLMKVPSTIPEKPPVLLCEDSKHALEKISSIISAKDYEDLGNHSTKAMGESSLFAVVQVIRPVTCMSVNSICYQSNSLFCSCIFFRQW